MKKAIMLFTTVIVMVVVVWEKTSGKAKNLFDPYG